MDRFFYELGELLAELFWLACCLIPRISTRSYTSVQDCEPFKFSEAHFLRIRTQWQVSSLHWLGWTYPYSVKPGKARLSVVEISE